MRRLSYVLMLAAIPATTAVAQQSDAEPNDVTYQQVTEMEFDDIDVNATITKPNVRLVVEYGQHDFTPMLKQRENFSREMVQAVREVK